MATFDYRSRATGEIVEIMHLPGEPAPMEVERDGVMWDRLPAAPRIVTADTRKFQRWPTEKELLAKGKRRIEPGHDKDVARAKRYKEEARERALEETVVSTVNRAMP